MSKVPIGRILSRLEEEKRGARLEGEKIENTIPKDVNVRKSLTNGEKQEIGDVIIQITKKVAELIALLDGLIPPTHQIDTYNSYYGSYSQGYDYRRSSGYGEAEVRKIRPLKNEITAGYFTLGEKLRIYRIGSDELIHTYYTRVKEFNTIYKSTTLTSSDVKDFYESIKKLIVGELNKAFK